MRSVCVADVASTISAKKKITRQDAQRMERDAKKHKNWKKKWTEVTQQPKKSPKGSWVGRATFEWVTGTDKGTKRSRPITLGDAATLTIRGGKLIVRPKGGQEYEYGDEESRKAAEAEQKRKQGKSPIDGLDTVQDLKKELLDNFETSLEMVDKFVRRERKRAKEGTTAASTSLGARLDAVVETLSGLRLPTPTVLALEVAASVLHARAAGINVFHGTTNKFARSILKNGLVRNAKNKVWDVDLDHGYSPNRVTYGGVYLTTNFMTAYSSAGNALRKLGGTGRLIIEARVQAKAAIGDEDSYHGPVDRFFNQAFGYSPNDFHIARAYLDPEEVAELRIKFASLFTDYAIQRGWVTAKNPKLRDAAEAMFDAALTRYASLPEKGSSYTVDTLWEKAGRSPPTKEEGNRVYREALDRLTRVTKGQAYKEREGFTHSLRLVDDDIDFKGANRIVSVVEIFDGKGEVPSRAKVLYGNPKNILEGIRQNIGPDVEVAVASPRMLSSAKEEQAQLATPTLLALEEASASFL